MWNEIVGHRGDAVTLQLWLLSDLVKPAPLGGVKIRQCPVLMSCQSVRSADSIRRRFVGLV